MICIIIGYADGSDKYFFSMNEGLKRRFPYRIRIKLFFGTNQANLSKESKKELRNCVDDSALSNFFEKNRDSFKWW